MKSQFDNKRILILGSSGSWAGELIPQLLKTDVKKVIGYARNEFRQVVTKRKFPDKRFSTIIGDIRDFESVNQVCSNADIVFILSALKHVPICEDQPDEAIKTNIIGVENVIKACLNNGVSKCVDVSTDKSANPNTVYGATKFIGERLILNANRYSSTEFTCIRAGNCLGTNGSVVPLFLEQIHSTNKITVTDGSMTRFFMSLPEAIKLLLMAEKSPRGSLLVMKMKSCEIKKLAETMKEMFGNKNTIIEEIGARPSEKKHELLVSPDEVDICYEYNKDYYIVSNDKLNLPKVKFKEYGSNTQPLMNKAQIKQMLIKGGFIK